MVMPKGNRVSGGYATVNDDPDALGLREISEIMTADGHKMNHASVRNHLIRAMRKFVMQLDEHYCIERTPEELDRLAKDPSFQEAMMVLVQNVCAPRPS